MPAATTSCIRVSTIDSSGVPAMVSPRSRIGLPSAASLNSSAIPFDHTPRRVRARRERAPAKAASGAGFTPAERAGGLGGAPLAPPSSMTSGAGFTPAERAGGLGGAPLAPPSSMTSGAGFTPAERAGGLGGAPLAPPSSMTAAGGDADGDLGGRRWVLPEAERVERLVDDDDLGPRRIVAVGPGEAAADRDAPAAGRRGREHVLVAAAAALDAVREVEEREILGTGQAVGVELLLQRLAGGAGEVAEDPGALRPGQAPGRSLARQAHPARGRPRLDHEHLRVDRRARARLADPGQEARPDRHRHHPLDPHIQTYDTPSWGVVVEP